TVCYPKSRKQFPVEYFPQNTDPFSFCREYCRYGIYLSNISTLEEAIYKGEKFIKQKVAKFAQGRQTREENVASVKILLFEFPSLEES
ncbi:MAG: hypothetical protein WCI20_15165, partial [bacterium]